MNNKKFKVITLCGSTRFKDEFIRIQKELTLQGNIVLSVGLFGHSSDKEVWENMPEETITKTRLMLDDMHKRKIDMSDAVYIINPDGYIGSITESELKYALSRGKEVMSLEHIDLDKYRTSLVPKYDLIKFTLKDLLLLFVHHPVYSQFNQVNTNNKSFPDKYRYSSIGVDSLFVKLTRDENPENILDRYIDHIALLPACADICNMDDFLFILDVENGFRRVNLLENNQIQRLEFMAPAIHIILKDSDK